MEYCKDSNKACRSLLGLLLCMSISNVSSIWHAYWSLIRHVSLRPSMSVSDGSLIRDDGLRLGMSVFNGSRVEACRGL